MSAPSHAMEQELLQRETDWMQAVKEQDIAAVEQILATEFALTSTLPRAFDKQRYLSDLPLVKTSTFALHDSVVHVYGDVAVVRTGLQWEATFDGRPWEGAFNITDVWVRRDGRWQVVTRHSSRPVTTG